MVRQRFGFLGNLSFPSLGANALAVLVVPCRAGVQQHSGHEGNAEDEEGKRGYQVQHPHTSLAHNVAPVVEIFERKVLDSQEYYEEQYAKREAQQIIEQETP